MNCTGYEPPTPSIRWQIPRAELEEWARAVVTRHWYWSRMWDSLALVRLNAWIDSLRSLG